MRRASAQANPNIALIKYWGKADEDLILPAAPSVSLTLDQYPTTTHIEPAAKDSFELNGHPASEKETARVSAFLDVVREWAGGHQPHAAVSSVNEAPTGAGLASSASGFAALALAAAHAYGLDLSPRDLSRLARRGSGSAARSIVSGVALWHAGTDADSFAEPIPAPEMRMVVVPLSKARKKVSSREAMRISRETSPYYDAWVRTTRAMSEDMVEACAAGDFARIGALTESSAWRMHGLIASSTPVIRYLTPASVEVFDAVSQLRADGLAAYGTADAGANVVVLTTPDDAAAVATGLSEYGDVTVCGPGEGARLEPGGEE